MAPKCYNQVMAFTHDSPKCYDLQNSLSLSHAIHVTLAYEDYMFLLLCFYDFIRGT